MSEGTHRRLAAIVSADVVGYSRLMGVDETGTLESLRTHRMELIDPKVAEHGGRIVKTMGDGLLLEFPSVVSATQCALDIQTGMAARNREVPDDERITFRIGVNLGDIIIDGDDIHGDGVNVAARLEALAEPGGICISDDVMRQIRGKLDVAFADDEAHELKNIVQPVHVWRWTPDQRGAAAPEKGSETSLPLPEIPSIVVLPFSNISGDPEQEYFSDGITEDITTELSRFSELFVIARNTAFTYKGQLLNIMEVARELGVHYVLEGSVRKAGNRVRINAQLIDGQNGNHLWAERYDGSIAEIFDLQDEVTRQVVSATVPHINEAELTRIRRGDRVFDVAHDLAWRALDEFENAGRLAQPALMKDAKAKAYQAIELNERCFLAYYVICMACWRELRMQWSDDPDETHTKMQEAAETYVSLAPRSHRGHLCNALAKFHARIYEAATQDLRHSVELNPNDGMVQSILAYAEVRLGNLNEAKVIAEKAIRLNPKDTWTGTAYLALAQAAFAEDDKRFRDYAEKAIRAQPNSPNRRALMIAYAAEVGDQTLLETHLRHLNAIAPRFIPGLLSGEVDLFKTPQYREKFLSALRKAVPSE
jgi:TolB-like protein/cytochrome c-type biogenesis protein CcmH/NrfG